jgi:hypothetical protein
LIDEQEFESGPSGGDVFKMGVGEGCGDGCGVSTRQIVGDNLRSMLIQGEELDRILAAGEELRRSSLESQEWQAAVKRGEIVHRG